MFDGGRRRIRLVGRPSRQYEEDLIQRERSADLACTGEVSEVDWIERASENTYAGRFGSQRTCPCPRTTYL